MKKKHINSAPLVSIITPLYNAESFIEHTLESVHKQSYTHWEHLIVDDVSKDNSVKIVAKYAEKDDRITLVKNTQNEGAAFSRNKATQLATGAYIAFLDSDDLWHPEKLTKQIAFMQAEDCAVSFTNYLHMDEAGNPLNKRVKAIGELSYKKQHSNNYIGNLTGMYHAASIGKIMAPNIRKRQDWALWLEAIQKSGKPALGVQEDLAWYRVRANSMSANKVKLVQYNFRFYRQFLGYSWVKSIVWLLRFFWEYFMVRPKYIETW